MPSIHRFLKIACSLPLLASAGCQVIRPRAMALQLAPESSSVVVRARVADDQIAGIVLIANNIDISYAQLVPSRAASPDVQVLARRLTADHAGMNAILEDLLPRLDVAARNDSIGLRMRDVSGERRAQLEAIRGGQFDRGYAATEVQYHREMLDLIDHLLLPSVSQGELRRYLTSLRPTERAHLAAAEQLLTTLTARQ
jgi:putative membrane protein